MGRIFRVRVRDMQCVLHAGRLGIAPTYVVDFGQAAFALQSTLAGSFFAPLAFALL
jgi:hypothetical protein